MALSARGVPGEYSSRREFTKNTVTSHGGHVPHYNIHGHQHHRAPFKDKSAFIDVKEHPEWNHQPQNNTRTELQRTRRAEKYPDISYDLDGDGVVGQRDYFVGKSFDHDHDHRLNTSEKAEALNALKNGWLDTYSFGHDQAGCRRPFPVVQKRGKVLTVDNIGTLQDTYPPHWNANNMPNFPTHTDMSIQRHAFLSNAANAQKEAWDLENPFFVPEPPVCQEFTVDEPSITHISQRAEAEHQASRVAAGLLPTNTFVNPHREARRVGLDRIEDPESGTRTDLYERRKANMRMDLEEQRLEGEKYHVPYVVRQTQRENAAHEFRRPDDCKTLTKLRTERRQAKIEHDMANFAPPVKQFPRYSDQDQPWWTLQNGHCTEPPTSLLKAPPAGITGKVNETVHYTHTNETKEDERQALNTKRHDEVEKIDEMSDKAIKRWSSEFAELGQGQRGPRLFDGVRQAVSYSHDFTPLDHFSSFELIRKDSMRAEAERNQKLLQQEQRSLRAANSQQTSKELSQEGQSSPIRNDPNASVHSLGSSRSSSRMQSGSKQPNTRDLNIGAMTRETPASKVSLGHLDLKPKGDDLSMIERLDTMRYGKRESKPTTPRSTEQRTPPEKTSEMRRRKSTQAGKKTESESGGPLSKSKIEAVKEEMEPKEQRVMVRASGFQWIDRQAKGDALSQITEDMQQTPTTDMSRASLRNNSTHGGTHRKSSGRDSPTRSGSRKGYTPSQTPRVDQQ